MRKALILLLLSFVLATPLLKASHIVGGEFELVHLDGFNYNLRIIQYFDIINGNPGAEDSLVVAYIFAKRDDSFIEAVTLNKVLRERIPYTQPQCAIGNLATRRLEYERQITLDPTIYNDPVGYYVVFERCCRNEIIDNIIAPDATGQTFYLQFPPVVDEEGNPFVNSTPRLFPPLSDYGCVGQPYYASFGGFDSDGDSLVYFLASPRNSSAVSALPIPSPLPHPEVNWVAGIDEDNMIPGAPGLTIDPTGFLTVTPSMEGLFVFAMICEEWRNGQRIGVVQREFQMLVLDCGGGEEQPGIAARKQGETELILEDDTVFFTFGEDKCLDILITDPNATLGDSERITLEYDAFNFSFPVLFDSTGSIDMAGDTLVLEACFPECPNPDGSPFVIEFRAADRTCPLPLKDTLNLVVVVEPPPNADPEIVQPLVGPTQTLREGDIFDLLLEGIDADGDSLDFEVIPIGWNLEDFGFVFTDSVDEAGRAVSRLQWDTGCGVNNYGLFDEFPAWIKLNDADGCDPNNGDSIFVDLSVLLPPNTDPVVSTTLGGDVNPDGELVVEVNTFDDLNFEVFATDADGDLVLLDLIGADFDPADFNMEFIGSSGIGSTSGDFSWTTNCDLVETEGDNEFLLYFQATDDDRCKIPNADTVSVRVRLVPPPNEAPIVEIDGLAPGDTLTVFAGTTVDLDILATDRDNDLIALTLANSGVLDPSAFNFNPVTGNGSLTAPFSWNSLCAQLGPDRATAYFPVSFVVQDDYCVTPQTDTIGLVLQLQDRGGIATAFEPPNVFTPNEDEFNDRFFIEELPPDNCDATFVEIKIFNRWGREVFASANRDFTWDGEGASSGMYYVYIAYTDRTYKSYLHLIR